MGQRKERRQERIREKKREKNLRRNVHRIEDLPSAYSEKWGDKSPQTVSFRRTGTKTRERWKTKRKIGTAKGGWFG